MRLTHFLTLTLYACLIYSSACAAPVDETETETSPVVLDEDEIGLDAEELTLSACSAPNSEPIQDTAWRLNFAFSQVGSNGSGCVKLKFYRRSGEPVPASVEYYNTWLKGYWPVDNLCHATGHAAVTALAEQLSCRKIRSVIAGTIRNLDNTAYRVIPYAGGAR